MTPGIDVASPGAAGNVERMRLADAAYTSGVTGRLVNELTADGGLAFSYVGGAANGIIFQGPVIPVEVGGRYTVTYDYALSALVTYTGMTVQLRDGDNIGGASVASIGGLTGSGSGVLTYTPSTVSKLCVIVFAAAGGGSISGKFNTLTLQQVY